MAKCLVTGGAGFIGSHLVEHLVARNNTVGVLDNLTGGKIVNLSRVLHAVQFYPGDLADLELVRKATQGVQFVFHLAAAQGPFDLLANSVAAVHSDVIGTNNVLSAACAANVHRVIYASSLRVYGAASGAVCSENRPLQPTSAEGIAKALGEKACLDCTRDHGLETVRLRYFNVFGPRQPRYSPYAAVVGQALEAMLADRSPVFDGDGTVGQDMISVSDVVHANLIAIDAPRVSGKAYNIGRGSLTTAVDVVAALNAVLSTRIKPTFTGVRPVTDLDNRADVSRAEAELGYCAGEDLERSMRLYVAGLATWSGRPHRGRFNGAPQNNAANGVRIDGRGEG